MSYLSPEFAFSFLVFLPVLGYQTLASNAKLCLLLASYGIYASLILALWRDSRCHTLCMLGFFKLVQSQPQQRKLCAV